MLRLRTAPALRQHADDGFEIAIRRVEAAALWQNAKIALTASSFDIVVGYARMGFGICITSVSQMVLNEAWQGHSSYRGVSFRDLSKVFGQEQISVLHRKAKVELPHHVAFREIVVKALAAQLSGSHS